MQQTVSTGSMQTYLPGRVSNFDLPKKYSLFPLFEAISNSIHAIQDAKEKNGLIEIIIEREPEQLATYEEKDKRILPAIRNITVTDNGIGFNEENYESFQTLDSPKKLKIGGKGIGRILWLKAFKRVEIESSYKKNNSYYKRKIDFSLSAGVSGQEPKLKRTKGCRKTKVKLVEINRDFTDSYKIKSHYLALKILHHFLSYFLIGNCPKIIVKDDFDGSKISINRLFEEKIRSNIVQDTLIVKGAELNIAHLFLSFIDFDDHLVHFCANQREVKSESIQKYLPTFTKKKISMELINAQTCVYALFVWGEYLDKNVNSNRTDFSIEEDKFSTLEGFPSMLNIRDALKPMILNALDPVIEDLEKKKIEKIDNVVKFKHPYLDSILKSNSSMIENISADDSDEEIEQKLYSEYLRYTNSIQDQMNEATNFLEKVTNKEELESHKQKFSELYSKITLINHANLGKYVLQRKYVIEFLKDLLKKDKESASFKLEKDIHNLIYPMGKDSEAITYDQHNLWLLDERLSFHNYIASDFSLKKNKALSSISGLEPDIVIVKDNNHQNLNICLAGDEDNVHKSIVLIEFKRPGKTGYGKDPIDQMLDYIDAINEGKLTDDTGRPIKANQTARFFCFLICDINKEITKSAKRTQLLPSPDLDRWYGFIKDYNCFFEIFDYGLLAIDAEKRNNVLFHKLGLNSLNFKEKDSLSV